MQATSVVVIPDPKKRVLFVCSGNYYRSRLAEILFNHEATTAGLAWEADSRGLLDAKDLKGLSDHAVRFLQQAQLADLAAAPRDPLPLDVEDLTAGDLVVAMCEGEHRSMIEQKFASIAKAMLKAGRLRYWNVRDIPGRPHAIVRLLGGGYKGPCQPPESGTEHIAFAVRDLVRELARG
jgi:protein-tyrosine phosphatase